MKKQLFFTITTITLMFGLTIFFADLAFLQFRIANRDVWVETVQDFSFFYSYITLTWATIGGYLISGLLAWFAVQKLKKSKGGWTKWITTTGLIALFLAPAVFVDPEQAPVVMDLLSAAKFKTPSLVLPAWVGILRYWIEASYLWYRLIATLITFWTVPLVWFVFLGLSLSTKGARNFLWPQNVTF